MAQKIIDWVSNVATTTGAGTSTVITYPVPASCAVSVDVRFLGRSTGGDTILIHKECLMRRGSSGGVSLVGSVVDIITPIVDLLLAGNSAQVVASGNDILVQVVTTAGSTIEWFVDARIRLN